MFYYFCFSKCPLKTSPLLETLPWRRQAMCNTWLYNDSLSQPKTKKQYMIIKLKEGAANVSKTRGSLAKESITIEKSHPQLGASYKCGLSHSSTRPRCWSSESMIAVECERRKPTTGKGENEETRRGRNIIPDNLASKIRTPLSVCPLHVLRESTYLSTAI